MNRGSFSLPAQAALASALGGCVVCAVGGARTPRSTAVRGRRPRRRRATFYAFRCAATKARTGPTAAHARAADLFANELGLDPVRTNHSGW